MFDGTIFPDSKRRTLERAYERLVVRHDQLDEILSQLHDDDLQDELDRVRTALSWFVVGLYGRCCVCGGELPSEQLDGDAADMACHDCKGSAGRSAGRLA